MNTPSPGFAAAIADRYFMEREIGRGGMATVYLANDLKHGRRVAIKVMAPKVAEMAGPEHFLREIEIAARLNHPHILPLFDSGVADNQLYYVMPFIEGESLRARLQREKRLSLGEALRLTREIAGALNHAHLHGLVHRDVKPENVLLSDGIPLVADFGIAHTRTTRAIAANTTSRETVVPTGETQWVATVPTGEVIGTPLYMAPEQAAGRTDLDGRADQYALGCVFYELLAGEPPFHSRNVYELLVKHTRDDVPDIVSLRPEVPEDVARALARTLAKDPADRFPGMIQFVEALNAAAVRIYALAYREGEGSGVPNNLPIPATSFIGREEVMAAVKELLQKTRLLTLTGSGGTGKTRLSLQVAAEVLEQYPDGVWMVELAPLSDPELVPQAVATALGVREARGETITRTLISAIRNKQALLVLDNCEHLLEASAHVVDLLLKSCPRVRVIASSREALGIAGEVSYRVPSLSVPDLKQPSTPESVADYAAARLFVERAVAAKPDFVVTTQNASALASICRRLDGMPLAIELAAARVRALPVEQIEARLDSRFRLLTGGSRTALPRQQTLRALIDWSYDLLKESEKAMLRRLSVFAGGCTLESAEKVCAGEGIDEFDVLDLMTSLVDKCLTVYEEAEGTVRYRLLETVRQYARDRLLENGDAERWRDRHLMHFLAMGEEAMPYLMAGAAQQTWLERIDTEHENLRAALQWAEDHPANGVAGLRLAGALQSFWVVRGHLFEGRERLARALARDPGEDPAARARSLNGAGNLAFAQGDYAAARKFHEDNLAIRRELDDRNGIATALHNLASVAFFQGDLAATRTLSDESLRIRRELGDRLGIASSLNSLALVAQRQEDHASARALLSESMSIRRELGDRSGVAASLHNLGVISMLQDDHDSARSLWEESLAIRRELGDRSGIATSLHNLGTLALTQGDHTSARALFVKRLAIARELGDQLGIAASLEAAAAVAVVSGAMESACRFWAAASRLREEIGSPAPAGEQEPRDREMDGVRQALGEQAFAAAWSEGRAMMLEDVLKLAGGQDSG